MSKVDALVTSFFDTQWNPHGACVAPCGGLVFCSHGKFDPNAVAGKGPNELGLPEEFTLAGRKEWLKRMIAYWGDDLGAPSGRNDVARTHEEYDVMEARRECLWPDKEFGPFRYRAHDNRLDHTSLFYLFPEGRARANVPADKDKRVRLAYLHDYLFRPSTKEEEAVLGTEDGLAQFSKEIDEYALLKGEVSPWGGDTRYVWDGKLSG